MLVSAKDMLNKARDGKYAVGQFNINNLEWTKAILLTAEELKSPVILGVSAMEIGVCCEHWSCGLSRKTCSPKAVGISLRLFPRTVAAISFASIIITSQPQCFGKKSYYRHRFRYICPLSDKDPCYHERGQDDQRSG